MPCAFEIRGPAVDVDLRFKKLLDFALDVEQQLLLLKLLEIGFLFFQLFGSFF